VKIGEVAGLEFDDGGREEREATVGGEMRQLVKNEM